MADYYVIKLINKDGTRGWLIDRPDGIEIAVGGIIADVTQFESEESALKFIRDRKIERSGIKAYVRTNQELIEEGKKNNEGGMFTPDKPIYYIENHKGEKLFYDAKQEGYFFKKGKEIAGYPCWYTEDQIRTFVEQMEFKVPLLFMVKHSGKDKEEKTLIQALGIPE